MTKELLLALGIPASYLLITTSAAAKAEPKTGAYTKYIHFRKFY